ncbi:MAG: hypothetical protein JKY37_19520 [Nannocystaceae bacterium]|nr:hypothetical protein [Nannocystaceae bacterium]
MSVISRKHAIAIGIFLAFVALLVFGMLMPPRYSWRFAMMTWGERPTVGRVRVASDSGRIIIRESLQLDQGAGLTRFSSFSKNCDRAQRWYDRDSLRLVGVGYDHIFVNMIGGVRALDVRTLEDGPLINDLLRSAGLSAVQRYFTPDGNIIVTTSRGKEIAMTGLGEVLDSVPEIPPLPRFSMFDGVQAEDGTLFTMIHDGALGTVHRDGKPLPGEAVLVGKFVGDASRNMPIVFPEGHVLLHSVDHLGKASRFRLTRLGNDGDAWVLTSESFLPGPTGAARRLSWAALADGNLVLLAGRQDERGWQNTLSFVDPETGQVQSNCALD